MKIPDNETPGFQFKRIALLGMSGLGKRLSPETYLRMITGLITRLIMKLVSFYLKTSMKIFLRVLA